MSTIATRRDIVDHALSRRAALAGLATGRVSRLELCDASPYLQRAARTLGSPSERTCPVCTRAAMWDVLWVYGEALGDADGSARSRLQVGELARSRPDFSVYEIEVCPRCDWNHLIRTWRAGTAGTAPARRSRRASVDP